MPDYFDRLLARHVPARAAGGAAGPALVRPRLPGPYERVEALRAGSPEPDESAFPFSEAPRTGTRPVGLIRHEREIRTERRTVVRTEPARPAEPVPAPAPASRPAAPLLRPAAQITPAPRPAAAGGARRERPAPAPAVPGAPPPTAAAALLPPGVAVAPPAVPLRPRSTDAGAARDAARSATGRRRPPAAERVVHVQIGRLEVSAAGSAGQRGGSRPERVVRPAPALSLEDYLSRGEKRS